MSVSWRARIGALSLAAFGVASCGDTQAPDAPAASPAKSARLPSEPSRAEPAPAAIATPVSSQDKFWDRLSALCGQAYAGYLTIGTEESDREFGESDMTMHVRDCTQRQIRVPFSVGDDRSRTWVIERVDQSLSLRHRHVDRDGQPVAPDDYGGRTTGEGTAARQEFEVDDATAGRMPETRFNVWAIEVVPGKTFAYELQRPEEDRFFRVEFDLDEPVNPPPASWSDTS